jgi:hypothetical protein
MTIQDLKKSVTVANWNTEKVYTFKELKENKELLKFTGIYILTEGDEVVYIGSAYTRYLRERLLQYQQKFGSGNKNLYKDLIDSGKTTKGRAHNYIINLTIHAIQDESLEYILIQKCDSAVNLVGNDKAN